MNNNKGFTLMEIVIAAAIFSGFMVGVFSIFSNGTSSFIAGNWKIQSQNKLRLLMENVKSDIEKANNVFTISQSSQTQIATTPIYINSLCYIDGVASLTTINIMTATTFTPIMFISVTSPQINKSIFSPTAVSGKWYGASLWARKGKLYFTRTGKTTKYMTYPAPLPGVVVIPFVTPGGTFEPSKKSAFIVMEDVESIGFAKREITEITDKEKYILKIQIKLRRTRGGETTNTTVEEVIEVKLQEMTNVSAF